MSKEYTLKPFLVVIIGVAFLVITLVATEEWGVSNDLRTISRSEAIEVAATDPVAWDCLVQQPARGTGASESQSLFRVGAPQLVTPTDGRDYTTAIWSPRSDVVVFVSPTSQVRALPRRAGGPTGISVNELWLYRPANEEWKLVTKDGASPRFSSDGQFLYYLSRTQLIRFDLRAETAETTGISVAETAESLTLSIPLRDGGVLAPRTLGKPLQRLGTIRPEWQAAWELAVSDRLLVSPTDTHVIVSYSSTDSGQSIPSVAILYTVDGHKRPLLRNCSYSVTQLAWAPDGSYLAYPVLSERPAVHLVNLSMDIRRVLTPFGDSRRLSGLSFSPGSRFLALTAGDHRDGFSEIWIVSTDGTTRQYIGAGMLPHWSPDGRHLLYALPGHTRLLDWYLVNIEEM